MESEQKEYLEVSYTCRSCRQCQSVVVNWELPLLAIIIRAQIHHAKEVSNRAYSCGSPNGKRVVIYSMVPLKEGTIPERITV
jgi:hypothetical protein